MNHTQAAQIVKEEWQKVYGRPASKLETLFTMCVAWIETGYGRINQFKKWAEDGDYNWGNLTANKTAEGMCPIGSRSGGDTYEGKPVTACFKVYKSDNEAANALIRNLTGRHWPVIQAIQSDGTAESVAHAMKTSPVYYTAPEPAYASALKNAATAIGKELKENYETISEGASTGSIVTGLAIMGIVGGIFAGTLHIKGKR